MKYIAFIAVLAVTILIAGCGKKPTTGSDPRSRNASVKTTYSLFYNGDPISEMSKEIDRSQVVASASMDTNSFPNFVVTVSEIWKGVSEASVLGITNGTHFALRWPTVVGSSLPGGHFPDHAILTIPRADSPSIALQMRSIHLVYDGRILGMTTQEYKARFGL